MNIGILKFKTRNNFQFEKFNEILDKKDFVI